MWFTAVGRCDRSERSVPRSDYFEVNLALCEDSGQALPIQLRLEIDIWQPIFASPERLNL